MKVIEQYEIMPDWTEDTPITVMDSGESPLKWTELSEDIKESEREILAMRVKNKLREVIII